jgi:PAS domain S-box-containing protein
MAEPAGPADSTEFRYGVAVAVVGVAATLNLAVRRWLPDVSPLLFFPTAIVVAAIAGGIRAGFLATILAYVVVAFVYVTPPPEVVGPHICIRMLLFAVEGGLLTLIAANLGSPRRPPTRSADAPHAWPSRHGSALVIVAAALAIKLLCFDGLSRPYPFMGLFVAVALAAWAGGLVPAIIATILAAVTVNWFWLEPRFVIGVSRHDFTPLALFVFEGSLIAVACTWLYDWWTAVRHQGSGRYRQLLEAVRDYAVFQLNTAGRVATWNTGAQHILGCTEAEALGRSFAEFATAEDRAAGTPAADLAEATAAGRSERTGWRERSDGVRFWAETVITPDGNGSGYAVVIRDVSVRRQSEEASRLMDEKLRQAQRLEAVGKLAGGIAHDFNNLLTIILGNLELIREQKTANEMTRGLLDDVRDAGQRAAVLTRQLLAFSRRQPVQPRPIDLNAVVTDMGSLLRRTIAEHIVLVTDLRPGLGPILADPGQLEQVVLNLAVNARDAMPRGGTLTIRTAEVRVAAADLPADVEGAPGQYVVLAVTDTGHGMDEATKARIFEPFFTTKPIGKGTGMGLAIVYGNVKQAHGWIAVDSRPEMGTTFRVFLPRAEGSIVRESAPAPALERSRGSETILLVEDEPPLRDLARRTLEAAGYTVLACGDGRAAMEASRHFTGPIDLLLTDLIMPIVNGRELAALIKPERPGIRVLFMSGYTESTVANLGPLEGGEELLDKPFLPVDLTKKVREMLDRK